MLRSTLGIALRATPVMRRCSGSIRVPALRRITGVLRRVRDTIVLALK